MPPGHLATKTRISRHLENQLTPQACRHPKDPPTGAAFAAGV